MKKAVTKKESENMGAEIFAAVDILESTKGIPRTYMLEKIEAALVSAYKKESGAVNVRIALDGEKKTDGGDCARSGQSAQRIGETGMQRFKNRKHKNTSANQPDNRR